MSKVEIRHCTARVLREESPVERLGCPALGLGNEGI